MKNNYNIIIAGIGGQGVVTASNILSNGLASLGYDVKTSETYGMAQRGGSVYTHLRFGKKIWSPLIEKGDGDIILGFELIEALRYKNYLKSDGTIIVNKHLVSINESDSIDNYIKMLESIKNLKIIDCENLYKNQLNCRYYNIVLLGVMLKYLGFESSKWEEIIKKMSKQQYVEKNIEAFKLGMNY